MIDSDHLGEPGNVAVENETHLDLLKTGWQNFVRTRA